MKNWIKIAGICGIIIIVLSLILNLIDNFYQEVLSNLIAYLIFYKLGFSLVSSYILSRIIVSLPIFILYILVYYGFVLIGKKYNTKLLRVSGWLIIVSYLLLTIEMIIQVYGQAHGVWALPTGLLYLTSSIDLFKILSFALFGITLIILNKKIKYALLTGILILLNLLPDISYSILIMKDYGIFSVLSLIALILEIIILFNASKENSKSFKEKINPGKGKSKKKK